VNEHELERRRAVVGASEVGLLFGCKSFGGRTISDLWFEKKFGVTAGGKGNASTRMGNKLEPVVLEWAEERLEQPIIDRQKWIMDGVNGATIDGRLASGEIVEAKTSGVLWRVEDEWGDDGTDEVPESYLLQVQAQLLVSKAELAYLAALIGGIGFRLYRIEPHQGLLDAIKSKAEQFVASLEGDAPPDAPPTLETLKRIRRQPAKILPRSDAFESAWQALEQAKADAKVTDAAKDAAQRQLLALLGNAEAAEVSGGLITYYEQSRKESFVAASTFRVMRFKKGG
jgi:predicted phage-related endonuclease